MYYMIPTLMDAVMYGPDYAPERQEIDPDDAYELYKDWCDQQDDLNQRSVDTL